MHDNEEHDLMDIVEQYVDTFGEGPPIFDLDDDEAIRLMLQAIADKQPMSEEGES